MLASCRAMFVDAMGCSPPVCTGNARQCQTPQPTAACPVLAGRLRRNPFVSPTSHTAARRPRGSSRTPPMCSYLKPFQAFAEEDSRKTRDKRFKDKIPDLPSPGQHQQTLKTSFTVGGLGLHSGEYAFVRIRPAYAGEGRYFVRVPEGTNSGRFQMEEPEKEVDLEDVGEPEAETSSTNQEANDLQVQMFLEYLKLQEDTGYEGTFGDFVGEELSGPLDAQMEQVMRENTPAEEVVERSEEEDYVLAHMDSIVEDDPIYTTLGSGDLSFQGVEHLLSALEMLGVDNARIEVEGGSEIPIVDGSALGWTVDVQSAGLQRAVQPGTKDTFKLRRVPVVQEPLLVTGSDGAYISFVPGSTTQLTAGVDHAAAAPIIGRQLVSWAPGGGEQNHYRWQVAPARNYAESTDALQRLRAKGYIKGGTADCSVIAFGDRWYDTAYVRFYDDEPSRHKLVDLTGDLSLLATGGGGGVPNGHVLAWKADHALHATFLRELASKIEAQ